ncbi:transcriptional regulator [Endozoicomonas sp.]|uniref:HVO_A0114 family putative DNA-binding protein n=1 Tax=Endozoicomonas sp. TaxID=1892382 RepID=UPI002884DAC0|nr:transcriptional regulator [Endozoicomonas sp.]
MNKVMKIGIMPKEAYRARLLAIAKGQYTPVRGEPKIWFESFQAAAQLLSNENIELLRLMAKAKPESIKALSELTGRKDNNLSRILKSLEKHKIVRLEKTSGNCKKPVPLATSFCFENREQYYVF